jgi:predicted membrane metal-binding protein
MTVWDPQTLWDMGFQLSALATASLFAYGKGAEALLPMAPSAMLFGAMLYGGRCSLGWSFIRSQRENEQQRQGKYRLS